MTDFIVTPLGVVIPYKDSLYGTDSPYGTDSLYGRDPLYGTDSLYAADSLSAVMERMSFLAQAVEGNLANIRLGQLAQTRGRSERVRCLGEMLEENHCALDQKARILADSLDITSLVQPNPEARHNRLSKLRDGSFDGEFLKIIIADHMRSIKKFHLHGKFSEYRALANETLSIL